MRRGRFTVEQIHGVVREVETGTKVPEVRRRRGISKNSRARWRAKCRRLELVVRASP